MTGRATICTGFRKHPAENHPLGVPGVLILVQQDDFVTIPERLADSGMRGHQLRRDVHLVSEVDHPRLAFGLGERVHQRQDPGAIL